MEFKALFGNFNQPPGKVTFISVRPARLEPVKILAEVIAIKDKGLEGDRYHQAEVFARLP